VFSEVELEKLQKMHSKTLFFTKSKMKNGGEKKNTWEKENSTNYTD
jgi:hypothetical protein